MSDVSPFASIFAITLPKREKTPQKALDKKDGFIYRIKKILIILYEKAMRLTRAGEYAVRCSLYLSLLGKGVLATRKDIARTMEIPEPFLGKIAQQLARAGIIEIVQGARGGYRLIKPPETLTLLEVVEAVIGEIVLNDCVLNPDACYRSPTCSVHLVWQKARDQLRETLSQTRFADLMAGNTCTADMMKTPGKLSGSVSSDDHQ
jgi:Rrf2 family protein